MKVNPKRKETLRQTLEGQIDSLKGTVSEKFKENDKTFKFKKHVSTETSVISVG